ncbi:MAG: phosphoribosylamine--glycine ligase, partial [Candidatus Woesearchaeota archaeon]
MAGYRFLFVSRDGYGADLSWSLTREGNQVKLFIENKDQQDIFDNMVKKTSNWKQEIDWAQVIVFDDVLGAGHEAKKLRKKGKWVI